MKKLFSIGLFLISIALISCEGQSQSQPNALEAKAFSDALAKKQANDVVLDVRTAGEFANGYIENAVNIDVRNANFLSDVKAKIPTDATVYVYCLAGSRSHSAAEQLRQNGYSKVVELTGGIIQWEAAGLSLSKGNAAPSVPQTSKEEFDKMVNDTVPVLVDFYAPWCAPCKKMNPLLDDFFKKNAGKYVLVKINADEQKELCKTLNITSIPVFQVYKNGKQTWNHLGETTIEEIEKQLK